MPEVLTEKMPKLKTTHFLIASTFIPMCHVMFCESEQSMISYSHGRPIIKEGGVREKWAINENVKTIGVR